MVYAVLAYVAFLSAAVASAAFVAGVLPGRNVDVGPPAPHARALAVDLCLLLGMVLLRALSGRIAIRSRWAWHGSSPPTGRSTGLLISAAVLGLAIWCWRPLPDLVWQTESRVLLAALAGLCAFGWLLALWATFWIGHFDLLGLRQAALFWAGRPYRPVPFQVEGAYRFVRHPMMLGALLGLWATPRMSLGHLLLAGWLSAWIVVGAALEERTLAAELGEPYRRYLVRVPAFVPRLRPRRRGAMRRR
jgi:protein-S-isoprenylcysteine O-methyltransferase Ste14